MDKGWSLLRQTKDGPIKRLPISGYFQYLVVLLLSYTSPPSHVPTLPNMSATIDQSSPATRVTTPIPDDKIKALEQVSSFSTTVVVESDRENDILANSSTARKIALMAMFSAAQFLDIFNNRYCIPLDKAPKLIAHPSHVRPSHSALFPAIPDISARLSFAPSQAVWIVSAYQLTLASFMLVVRIFTHQPTPWPNNAMKSGRISDVYSPKPAFVTGAMIIALTHLGAGFVQQKIVLLVLRALGGIGSAFTIPAALSMIVALFPDQQSQSRAIAIFGSTASVGNGKLHTCCKETTIFTLGSQQSWD